VQGVFDERASEASVRHFRLLPPAGAGGAAARGRLVRTSTVKSFNERGLATKVARLLRCLPWVP
jgi:hypothetical protein